MKEIRDKRGWAEEKEKEWGKGLTERMAQLGINGRREKREEKELKETKLNTRGYNG